MSKFDMKGIASALAAAHNISEEDAENFLKVVCEVVLDALRHDGLVKIKGLGTFKLIGVPEREMVDVNTGERITVEARNRISFSPDAILRDIINKPFVFFDTVVLKEGVVFDDENDADSEQNEDEEQFADDTIKDEDSLSEESAADDVQEELEEDIHEETKEDVRDDALEDESSENTAATVQHEEENPPVEDKNVEIEEDTTSEDETAESNDEDSESEEETDTNDGDGKSADEPSQAITEEEEKDNIEDSRQSDTPQAVNDALADARSVMDDIESGNLDDEYGMYKEEGNFFTRNILNIFIILAVIIGAAAFIYGMYGNDISKFFESNDNGEYMSDGVVITSDSTMSVTSTMITDTLSTDTLKADTVKTAEVKKPVGKDVMDPEFYESLDVRVRTGAYRIVGVSDTVVLRKGQTFKSITKAYLGEGMECYMEVFNGVKSAEPGDTLRIPKLKWKKKRKK